MKSQNDIIAIIQNCTRKDGKINWKRIWYGKADDMVLVRAYILQRYHADTISNAEKAYRVLHSIDGYVMCEVCLINPTKFESLQTGFRSVCSCKCSGARQSVLDKRKETVLATYGVDNVSKNDQVKQKSKDTLLSIYGVDNVSKTEYFKTLVKQQHASKTDEQLAVIQEKRKATNLLIYGYEFSAKSATVKAKLHDTMLAKHGMHYFKTEEFKQQMSQLSMARYGTEFFSQSAEVKTKIADTFTTKYGPGISNASHLPGVQEKRCATMQQRYGKQWFAQQHLSDDIIISLASKEGTAALLCKYDNDIQQIMLDYGISYTTLIHKISEYSLWEKSRSAIEAEVAAYLDSLQIIYSQNCRNLIAPLEVDFLISEKKTAIEINGLYWHSELAGKDRKYHANKQKQVNAVDHKLIMLYDYEWVQKKDIIKSILNSKLGIQRRIFARKTTICYPTKLEKSKFLNDNHIQGNDNSKYSIGLLYDTVLVALFTAGKSRYDKRYEYEIIRFCSALGVTVVGGLSKLFSHAVTDLNANTFMTYADLRWGHGQAYQQIGFVFDSYTQPNYFYFKKNSRSTTETVIESRIKYQKHKLQNMLTHYDGTLTEWENMKNNNFNRYWDCGNAKYTWVKK